MISLLLFLGRSIWNCLEAVAEWGEMWLFTRRWEVALGSIPACVVALLTLFIVIGQKTKPAVAVAEPYRQALHEAFSAQNFAQADLCIRKLVELQVVDDNSRYEFARLALNLGKRNAAWEQMKTLAPENGSGYPRAHFWIAEEKLRRYSNWSSEDQVSCRRHLLAAKTDSSLQPRAAELLGVLALLEQNFLGAVEELKSIAEPNLNTRIMLAMAYHFAEQSDESHRAWTQVAANCERELKAAPGRNDFRLALAVAYCHLQQNDRAVQVLRDGMDSGSEAAKQRLQEALGLAAVQRLKSTARIPEAVSDQEKLLQELLHATSGSLAVAPQLIYWPEREAREARRIFEELSRRTDEDATTATAVNSLLEAMAPESNHLAEARTRLEQATTRDPNNPALLNNLAWVVANSQPPDLNRALELANKAVRLLPENATFRETRGQILIRQRKWQDAIRDLEHALPRLKPTSLSAVHAALAEAYSQLGNVERAAHHRAQITSGTSRSKN